MTTRRLTKYTQQNFIESVSDNEVLAAGEKIQLATESLERLFLTLENAEGTLETSSLIDNPDNATQSMLAATLKGMNGSLGIEAEVPKDYAASVEAVKETLEKIWQGIVEFIKRAISALADFFSKLFGGVERLKKVNLEASFKIQKLIKDKASLVGDDKVTVPGAEKLSYQNSLEPSKILKGSEEMILFGDVVYSHIIPSAQKTFDDINKFVASPSNTPQEFKQYYDRHSDRVEKLAQELVKLTHAPIPGGYIYKLTPAWKVKHLAELQFTFNKLDLIKAAKNKDHAEEIKVMDLPSLASLCNNNAIVLDNITKKAALLKTFNKAFNKSYGDLLKRVHGFKSSGESKADNIHRLGIEVFMDENVHKLVSDNQRISFSYSRTLMTYVKSCLQKYGANVSGTNGQLALPNNG